MKYNRLFRVLYYILEKGKVTANELADKFEVSARTIYRDIDSIQKNMKLTDVKRTDEDLRGTNVSYDAVITRSDYEEYGYEKRRRCKIQKSKTKLAN